MNNPFLKCFVLLPALFVSATVGAGEPVFGVCRSQISHYVEQHLRQTVTSIDIRNYTYRAHVVDHGDAIVRVKECDGFHAFDVYGTQTVCEHIPHYGDPGNYVRYQGAYGGCRTPG